MGSVTPPSYHYDRHGGVYRLLSGSVVLWESSKVAVAFAICPDGTVLRHQHGTPQRVFHWFQVNEQRYRQVGLLDQLFYVESEEWSVDDLNAIIHDPAYSSPSLRLLLDRAGLGMGEGCEGGRCIVEKSQLTTGPVAATVGCDRFSGESGSDRSI